MLYIFSTNRVKIVVHTNDDNYLETEGILHLALFSSPT
jgi:hypothetical protein